MAMSETNRHEHAQLQFITSGLLLLDAIASLVVNIAQIPDFIVPDTQSPPPSLQSPD
jgi:hypothetical protein